MQLRFSQDITDVQLKSAAFKQVGYIKYKHFRVMIAVADVAFIGLLFFFRDSEICQDLWGLLLVIFYSTFVDSCLRAEVYVKWCQYFCVLMRNMRSNAQPMLIASGVVRTVNTKQAWGVHKPSIASSVWNSEITTCSRPNCFSTKWNCAIHLTRNDIIRKGLLRYVIIIFFQYSNDINECHHFEIKTYSQV